MSFFKAIIFPAVFVVLFAGCKQKETEPKLIFKFKFDPTQERLDGFGNPSSLPANHGGQNPTFNGMTAHYIELAQGALTQVGTGAVLYHAAETNAGGSKGIDFSKATPTKDGEVFYEMPLKNVSAGEYEYLRVSLAYQNYDVKLFFDTSFTVSGFPVNISQEDPCTVASFIGYNTYIGSYKVKTKTITVNDDKLQGYWGFEYAANFSGYPFEFLSTGQAPGTTVVNPLALTSPIPAGSCLVTGKFDQGKLKIQGNETKDIVVTVSLSTNKSFEWIEAGTPDGKWEPTKGESIVDMGIRGMKPSFQ